MKKIDDLQTHGLKLIQDQARFCFGSDSVELANFADVSKVDTVADLGAGNGIISILLAGKRGAKVVAIEIEGEAAALAKENIKLNNLSDKIELIVEPMQSAAKRLKQQISVGTRGGISAVVTNPPYFKLGSGQMREGAEAARHEVFINQEQLVEAAADLLTTGGRFFVIYPTSRLAELVAACSRHSLEAKEIVLLNTLDRPPHLFLLKCVKNAKVGLKISIRQMKNFGMGE
ncbi:MAG: methyltransferase [Firmicutes bacterium]|nr:methyltransferase [Bacillota bacterium]